MRPTFPARPTTILSLLTPGLVLLAIWLPEFAHYYVPSFAIPDEIPAVARRVPDSSLLDELKTFKVGFLLTISFPNNQELLLTAEKLLQGDIEIRGLPHLRIHIPFSPDDMDKGSTQWQLFLAGFSIPDVLLRAYEVTGQDRFLLTARDIIVSWALYEQRSWLPKGYLWNDHAIAARVSVLADFWRLYRNHPAYDPHVAKVLFQFASRSAYLLSHPAHFTFATNHGVMQNLALWHLYLAFPTLPNVERYKRIALNRLREQLPFYINDEGVVLEHSAGYHRIGLELLSMALRYLTLMSVPIPHDWLDKYRQAADFYAQLRRPDGSLPLFGDTSSLADTAGPLMTRIDPHDQAETLRFQNPWVPKASHTLYPDAGYSIWWRGLDQWPNPRRLNQTVVAWSHFPGHGHKHADEMSVLLWAGGETWWSNVGYWTSGFRGRSEAESWKGSNAPHLKTEPTKSPRYTGLLSFGWSDDLAAIHLERHGPHGYIARRQVIHVQPNLWLVVDQTSGDASDRTTTQWTTSDSVKLTHGRLPGSYDLRAANSSLILTTFLLTSPGTVIQELRGSFTPFAGWLVLDGKNKPVDAIVVEQPADNSRTIAIWCLKDESDSTLRCPDRPFLEHFANDEQWRIALSGHSASMSIWRTHRGVYVDAAGAEQSRKRVMLTRTNGISPRSLEIRTAYESAARKYPKFRDVMDYRIRVTYVLISIFVVQEAFFFAYRRMDLKYGALWRILSVLCWAFAGLWLVMVYFQT